MKLSFSLICIYLSIGVINCSHRNVTAIEIKPCTSVMDGIQLSPKNEKIIIESFSFCIRFRIKTWTNKIFSLVEFENYLLYLTPFDNYLGFFQYFSSDPNGLYSLAPKKVLSFSTNSWNSMCLFYSTMTQSLTVNFNGNTLKTNLLSRPNSIGNFSLSQIKLAPWNDNSAYYTDFNAWSKALSQDEVKYYSAATYIYDDRNSPDIFDWRNLSGTKFNEKCAAWRSFDADKVRINNALNKKSEIFMTKGLDFYQAMRACEGMNGVTIDPEQSSYFNSSEMTTLQIVLETCKYKFWVPVKNDHSKFESGKTVISNQRSKENFLYGNDCTAFWYSNRRYEFARCASKLCSLCQLDIERLVFKLQLDCQEHQKIVSGSYAIEQPEHGDIMFTGLISTEEKSTIKLMNNKWILSMVQQIEKHVAESGSDYIFGLSKWTTAFCGDNQTTRVKFTNVSHFSIFFPSLLHTFIQVVLLASHLVFMAW